MRIAGEFDFLGLRAGGSQNWIEALGSDKICPELCKKNGIISDPARQPIQRLPLLRVEDVDVATRSVGISHEAAVIVTRKQFQKSRERGHYFTNLLHAPGEPVCNRAPPFRQGAESVSRAQEWRAEIKDLVDRSIGILI